MYPWIVYLHVLAVIAFMLTHGVSTVVALRLRSSQDPALARAWLELTASDTFFALLYGSLLALLLSGVVAAFMGQWWGEAWVWLSLLVLVAIIVAMFTMASSYYSAVRKALGMPYFDGRRRQPAADPASHEEIAALLAKSPALALAAIGFGGIAIILWLMMFKPF